jgi:hypothetical protein
MKIAHLILAHNNPEQLHRLVTSLTYADDAVYIHLDKKTPIAQFLHLSQLKNVFFVSKRVQVSWGSYNIVAATVNGFKDIISSGEYYDYVNLLSGGDYPLQTPQYIHKFLEANPDKAFMSYQFMHQEWIEALPRITRYHLTNYNFPGCYLLQKLLNRFMPLRKMPGSLVPVGRSQWFTASMGCIKYIVDYWNKHPRFVRFLRFTWGADEFAFQTILYNSVHRENMVNNNMRFMDWSANGVSPAILTMEHKDQVMATDKLFARKFDLHTHPEIMDALDEKIASSLVL